MYENVTYEDILQRMLDRVPNIIDKREGSIIYDALAPAAIELQLMYIEFDVILKETFGDTASREYLIRRAAERGIKPYEASCTILRAISTPANISIPIGARFSLDDLNYVTIEKLADGEYKVQCETAGKIGNKYFGTLIPIEYIAGLETIEITELLIPGEDEEETEALRTRYFETFKTNAYGGNQKDYIQKTNAINGVGATKVTPIWNGGGTVLLTILNSEFNKASDTLIASVQNEIDPTSDGSGVGIAPIGHIVTVNTAEEVPVNISTSITFKDGYSFVTLQSEIIAAIESYLLEIRKGWANESESIVRISLIDAKILNLEGVVDVSNTEINGFSVNLTLNGYEIPILGEISNG
ncbi:MAG: baseplate J/gp47 family protein [Oscillospiraceae bacterium]|nr:baseplate J/gp47 family protein [Oscillospiraceae bacterium]